jgi:PEP-CTERM motif
VKNFNILSFAKYALILGVAVFVMGLTPAHADTITIDPGAVFSNGATLSGTITTNSAGAVTSANIMIGSTDYTGVFFQAGAPGEYILVLNQSSSSGEFPALELVFSVGSSGTLAGYTGGALCTAAAPCDGDFTQFSPDGDSMVNLNSGNTSVPEPSTYLLLFSGLVGLGLLSRKRFAMNASS